MKWIGKIGIKSQVTAIPIVAFVGFGAILATNYILDREATELRSVKSQAFSLLNDVNQIQTGFLQGRRSEKDFFLRSDMKYAKRHAEVATGVLPYFDHLAENVFHEETRLTVDEMRTAYEAYVAAFQKAVSMRQEIGLSEKEGLRGKLRKAVHGVEEKLKQQDAPELAVTMLMMRRAEKDFFLRLKPKYLDKMAAAQVKFGEQATGLIRDAGARQQILDLLTVYVADFNNVAKLMLEEGAVRKQLSKLYAGVEPKLEEIEQTANSQFSAAAANIEENSQEVCHLNCVTGA